MSKAEKKISWFRFYAELNDFLPYAHRHKSHPYYFWGKPSIKNAIQAQGVPHTEVELILVNGHIVNFEHHMRPGDYISVYPVFKTLHMSQISSLHPEPLRNLKFVIDVNLGKLAKYVRLLGFDSLYDNQYSDEEIIEIFAARKRIILTRDLELLKHNKVTRGYFLRSTHPVEQLKELIRRFDLLPKIQPFTRCMQCNGKLSEVPKLTIKGEVKDETYFSFNIFFRCLKCQKTYWRGSHFERMLKMIENLHCKNQ